MGGGRGELERSGRDRMVFWGCVIFEGEAGEVGCVYTDRELGHGHWAD